MRSGGIDWLLWSLSSEFVLGVELLDAGVHVGSLLLVDPPGRDPFRQTVVVDAAGPALL